MDKRVTVNVPDAPPDEHDGEDLKIGVDECNNLLISSRTAEDELLAIYAPGFWADARIETMET